MALNQLGLGLVFTARDLATGVMHKVRNGFSQTRDELGRFGGRSKEAMESFKKGLAIFAAGAVVVAGFHSAIQESAMFSNKIAEISTLTDEASLNNEYLYDTLIDLNAQYGGGLEKQAKALYDGISAGASNADEATALMVASNRLAVAGVTEVNVALDGLTSSLNAYGVSFTKAGEFSDALFVGVTKGKTKIEELSHVIGRVAPTASALNISFDELVASLAAVTTKGLKTEEAATSLKAALANIIKPEGHAGAEAARLGIKFDAATVRAKGFGGLLKDITSSSKFNKDSLAKLFGSVEGLNAVLALTANGGKNFNDTLGAMKNKSGATDAAFEKMSVTLAFQQKRLAGALQNFKVVVGDALEPSAARMTAALIKVLKAFTDLPKPIRDGIVRAIAFAGVALMVVGALIALKAMAVSVALALFRFGAAGAFVGAHVLVPLAAAIALGTLLFLAFRQTMEDSEGSFGGKFVRAIEGIRLGWTALVQLFTQGGFSGQVRKEFLEGSNSFINFAIRIYLIVGRIKAFFSGIAEGFTAAIDAAKPSFEAFGRALSRLSNTFGDVENNTDENASAFDRWMERGKIVGDVVGKVVEKIVNVMTMAVDLATGVGQGWDEITDGANDFGKAVGEAWSEYKKMIGELARGAAEILGLGTAGKSTSQIMIDLGKLISTHIGQSLRNAAEAIKDIRDEFRTMALLIGGYVDIIMGIMEGDWDRVWNGVKKVVLSVARSVVSAIFGMVAGLARGIDSAGKLVGKDLGLQKKIRGMKDDAFEAMEEFADLSGRKGSKVAGSERGKNGPISEMGASPGAAGVSALKDATMAAFPSLEQLGSVLASSSGAKSVQVIFQVGEEAIAKAIAKVDGGAKSFSPAPLAE